MRLKEDWLNRNWRGIHAFGSVALATSGNNIMHSCATAINDGDDAISREFVELLSTIRTAMVIRLKNLKPLIMSKCSGKLFLSSSSSLESRASLFSKPLFIFLVIFPGMLTAFLALFRGHSFFSALPLSLVFGLLFFLGHLGALASVYFASCCKMLLFIFFNISFYCFFDTFFVMFAIPSLVAFSTHATAWVLTLASVFFVDRVTFNASKSHINPYVRVRRAEF